MANKILVSTAYFPPIEYFSLILQADEVYIEKEENYLKQSYRNRCYILSAHGRQVLTIPVYQGSAHKTSIKEIRIDYSKRWQQVHFGALTSSYNLSPYFEFYFEGFRRVISQNHNFLLDLNLELTREVCKLLKIRTSFRYTSVFEPVGSLDTDFRYNISPKKSSNYVQKKYIQVFNNPNGFTSNLSILDLLFNMGPESLKFL
jgi:hypothetical protein